MPDAGKDAEEKWHWEEHRGAFLLYRGKEFVRARVPVNMVAEINALQQQLADVRQERDRYRDALEYTQAYQWPLSPGVKIVLAAALTPGAKGETDVRAGE